MVRVTAARAGEAVTAPNALKTRLLTAGGLLCLVVAAVGLRLVPVIFVPSIIWGDEVYQTVEQAHRLVYGYGLIPWEFQVGLRSWLMPGLIAGMMEIARAIGDGPQYYLPTIAVGLGLLASAPVVCVFLWCRRASGLASAFVAAAAVAVAPELVYFGARSLNEVVAAHLLVIAFYLIEPGYPVRSRRRLFGAGALLAITWLLRIQLAPAIAVIALWPAPGAWRSRVMALIAGGAVALAFGAVFDWLTLGSPLASVWRNVYYNLYLGVSAGFGIEPWYYYLLGEFGVWAGAVPIVLILVALGARRMPALFVGAVILVVAHSAIAHKEYRFVYPAVVMAMVLAAVGLTQLIAWVQDWLHRCGMRPGIATASAMVVLFGGWCAIAFGVWSGGVIGELRNRVHAQLAAMAFVHNLPAPCGIGLYGQNAWVRYGGYTYLHLPVPMFWPGNDAELEATAGAFNTLLSDHTPSPQLGFERRRCFGKICITQRAGGCVVRPMPPMWFPEELRDIAPAPEKFEAIPKRLRSGVAARPGG
jgi:GPI mannosyltransferase 3